tara:strand:- start:399 stop:575 length:177 start_codon:yes stop_codon:yes gene_type:complete
MDQVDNIKIDDLKKPKRKYKELISSIQNNSKNHKEYDKKNKIIINGLGGGNFEKVEKI